LQSQSQKKARLSTGFRIIAKLFQLLLLGASFFEAVAAVNRFCWIRFERNLGLSAASGANRRKHLTITSAATAHSAATAAAFAALLTIVAARFATGGFVLKSFLGVEFLLTGCEREIGATVFTLQGLI
jgi:hypothetical protein